MKKIILIIFITVNSIGFSQSKIDTVYCSYNTTFSLLKSQPLKFTFQKLSPNLFQKKETVFSIYNNVTQLNDNYNYTNDSIKYNYSTKLIENDFRKNKIDSFNPNGAANLTYGLISGIFSLLVK